MKKILATFAMGIALMLAFACTKTEYELTGNIAGTVIDVDSGEPIQGATVTLSPTSKNTYCGSGDVLQLKGEK